jgi:CarD family transcriptional regulator
MVYDVLRDKEAPRFDGSWQDQYREYTHRIATGDPLMVAGVLRELHRLGTERALSSGERTMYDQVRSLVVEEVAAVREVEEAVVQAEIDAIFAA